MTPSDNDIRDAYIYLLGRMLALRQEITDSAADGFCIQHGHTQPPRTSSTPISTWPIWRHGWPWTTTPRSCSRYARSPTTTTPPRCSTSGARCVRGDHRAEIGDARRFTSSDQLVRFAGLDVTAYSSDGKRASGHLSRQGSPELRWVAFEAARCAARRGVVHPITPSTTSWQPSATATTARTPPWRWSARSCAAAITRCANSAMPPGAAHPRGGGRLTMRCARVPIPMPAASSRKVRHSAVEWTSRKE
jgi:Transposase IS116/IS110/IS902 family